MTFAPASPIINPPMMAIAAVALGSYLIGCAVAAYYVVRLRAGADIRASGSGNAGARNVLRTQGRLAAAITLALDAAKGAVAVLLAQRMLHEPWAAGLAFLFVAAGHIWPLQLRFRGGKGVAPSLGAMLVISPLATGAGALVTLAAFVITRDGTRSGLLGVGAAPIVHAASSGAAGNALLVAVACGLVLLAHHPRMARTPASATGVPS